MNSIKQSEIVTNSLLWNGNYYLLGISSSQPSGLYHPNAENSTAMNKHELYRTIATVYHTLYTMISLQSSSSRTRVVDHNWSATKQHFHPQSVAEISRHSVLSVVVHETHTRRKRRGQDSTMWDIVYKVQQHYKCVQYSIVYNWISCHSCFRNLEKCNVTKCPANIAFLSWSIHNTHPLSAFVCFPNSSDA